MIEFSKLVAAIKSWGWGRTCFLIGILLLAKKFVTFDQALILILLSIVLDTMMRSEPFPSQSHHSSTPIPAKNYRRRS